MQKPIPPRRDFRHLELRRQRAARWFAAGKLSLAEIARELQVSRQSVSRWYAQWKKGGSDAPPRCRPSRPQAQAESPTTPTSRASFAPRSARPRLRHRSVDAAPGGESDRALNRRALSPRPRVEDPARPGLEPATSR